VGYSRQDNLERGILSVSACAQAYGYPVASLRTVVTRGKVSVAGHSSCLRYVLIPPERVPGREVPTAQVELEPLNSGEEMLQGMVGMKAVNISFELFVAFKMVELDSSLTL
jgi:hypothetical protein